jgi:hypothetical protein
MSVEKIKKDTYFRITQMSVIINDLIYKIHENIENFHEIYMREAIRTTYYMMFQVLSLTCTLALVGEKNINDEDWVKIYRSFDHKTMKNILKQSNIKAISPIVASFASFFEELQDERLKADYDPREYVKPISELSSLIQGALDAAFQLYEISDLEARTLAVAFLFKGDRK